MKIASPHEHSLTFSLLNLNVVLSGVLVLLLIEVAGPIYGWAEYGFVRGAPAHGERRKIVLLKTHSID